jgi:hypothetical protein
MDLNLPQKDPYLYILMRSDLDSLNPGKMVAQGAHAANQFTYRVEAFQEAVDLDGNNPNAKQQYVVNLFAQWKTSTPDGFGVTICLDVSGDQLPLVVDAANNFRCIAGVTHDPSYPLLDGRVIHSIPLDTCGYVFGDKADLRILLGQFDLLK